MKNGFLSHKVNNFNEITHKFSVVYIENYEYSNKLIQNIKNSFLTSDGYLIITLLKSSINFDENFKNLAHDFQIIQELNIESYFRNTSLLVCKYINFN